MFTRRTHTLSRPGIALGIAMAAILLSAISAAPATPLPLFTGSGAPVARWRMDEGTGTTTADATGNGNTATFVGGVTWTTGEFGNGLSFNGSTGYLTVPDAAGLNMGTGSFTVAAWVNPTTTANAYRVMNKWDGTKGWIFDVNTGGGGSGNPGAVRFKTSDGTNTIDYSTSGPVVASAWQHVAATVDRTANLLTLYLNGTQIGTPQSLTALTGSVTNTSLLGMGVIPSSLGSFLSGALDETRLYSRALSASEVAGLGGEGPLEGLWHLDEGTGTTTADSSGNGITGTLTGGVTWTTGKTGNALSFDGTSGTVNLGSNLNILRKVPAATLACWYKPGATLASGSFRDLISISVNNATPTDTSRAALSISGNGTTAGNLFALGRSTDADTGQSVTDTTSLAVGTWVHVAATINYATNTIKLYVNGTLSKTQAVTFAQGTTADTASTSNALGSQDSGDGNFQSGVMDEVRVYSRALSDSEIAGLAGGSGTGLSAVYYNTQTFTGSFVQQTDPNINFNWAGNPPVAGIGGTNWSAIWTGQVQPQFGETYTFFTNTDDGVRLYVNGQLLVDFPQLQAATEHSGSIALVAGVKVDLRMEYFQNTGLSSAVLSWSSASTPKAVIPQAQLYPTYSQTSQFIAATASSSALTTVYLRFNEAMDVTTSTTTSNYTISGGLNASAASISSDKKVVTLTTSGNVILGTTTVTANTSIVSIDRKALTQTTKTIVSGNSQGIPDSTAIGLLMTTDGNHSAIMQNEISTHAVPQGEGEALMITPGTAATTVTLQQVKLPGGTGHLNFLDTGNNFSTTVTTSGGTPNQASVNLRWDQTSAFEADVNIQAVVSGQVQGVHSATLVQFTITPKYSYLADQTSTPITGQIAPVIQNLQFTNATGVIDYGKTDITTPTAYLGMPSWPATNTSGQTSRTLSPAGVDSFVYDSTQLLRPQAAAFSSVPTLAVGAKVGSKNKPKPKCTTDKTTDPYKDSPGGNYSNSIKLSDGEKKLNYRDLSIKGRGFDFIFGRMYRSSIFQRALAATGAPVVQDFGVGWSYSYADDYLIKDGTGSEDVSNMITMHSDHDWNVFVNIGTQKWSSGQDDFTQLRKNSAGAFEIRENNGMVSTFNNFQTGTTPNVNGRLVSMADRNGNTMTFHYAQIDPNGIPSSGDEKFVLTYVIDTLGREIRYQYYAATNQFDGTAANRQITVSTTNTAAYGRLYTVKDFKGNMSFGGSPNPDFPGQSVNRTLTFDYDADGNLVRVSSPAVTGTPNGNDFPNSQTLRYNYITNANMGGLTSAQWNALSQTQKNRLLNKLTVIWYPNEVMNAFGTNPPDSNAREVITYITDSTNRFFGYVSSYTIGGTNGNGVPSGGSFTYSYTDLNPSHGIAGAPYNYFLVQSLQTVATDRNGNQGTFIFSAEKTVMSRKEFPRGLRASEPASYEIDKVWNGTGNLRMDSLETQRTNPEGDVINSVYNDASTDRFQQGNRVRTIRTPGPRGGDQTTIESVVVYEPIYNQPWLRVSARGSNSAANGFTPPIAEPSGTNRTITDPYDATKTLNLRYAVVNYYDYQESTLASTAWPATSTFTPTTVDGQTVLATEVLLLRKLGLPDGNDTDRANSIRTVRSRLSANLVKLGLGDLNGDGNTDPKAAGNVIRTAYGSPVLITGSNQHALETAIDPVDLVDQTKNVVDGGTQEGTNGGRLQTIVWMYQYNSFGNMTKTISPEGNVTLNNFFAENDPDGDGIATPTPADGRILDTQTGTNGGGYLSDTTNDTPRSYVQQSTGSMLTGAFSNNNTNPTQNDIKTSYTYDDVGNVITMTNPRGIRTDYFVNELNQVVQKTRASNISGASTTSPSDPLVGDPLAPLTAFAFLTRTFFDYNGNTVLLQIEDRGNTSNVDGMGLGSLPSQATSTTPGLSNADPVGGAAFVDTLHLYDRVDDLIESRTEVDNTRSLNTRHRYDGNQQRVLTIYPKGNADSRVYDERRLLFQMTQGASSRPSAGLYASGDPTTFDRPGGSGTTPSTFTLNYDKNGNLVESVDAADNGGEKSSIAGGSGDVTRYTYDGFNRRTTATDPLDNKTTLVYDSASNIVRMLKDGDPLDDVIGSGNNKTLTVTETIYDELSRVIISHRVLFQTPGVTPSRTPVLTDGPLMNAFLTEGYLSDANSNTAAVPGATGITVIGRISNITEYDRESRVTFRIEDSFHDSRTDYDGARRVIKTTDSATSNGFSGSAFNPANISGNLVETAYDDNGNVIERKDTDVTAIANVTAEVFRTTFLYDSLDHLQTQFDNLGRAIDYRYDSRSNSVASGDAVGPVTSRLFNRRGLGSSSAVTINSYGNVARRRYDGPSRVLESESILTSSGQGDGTHIGATLEGIQSKTGGDVDYSDCPSKDTAQSGDGLISVYYAWDDNSQLLAIRDDDGNTTESIYDNENRQKVERKGVVITGTAFTITGGDSGSFDHALRGGVTPVNRIPAGTDITRTFDQDSNVTTLVDEAGNSFANTYDALNREKTSAIIRATGFIGTTSQTFKFDGLSRMTQCFDNNDPGTTADDVTCTNLYDSISRKVEEQCQIGSLSAKATSYSYEISCSCGAVAVTLPTETMYPDGRGVHSDYDNLDRLISRNDGNDGDNPPIGTYQYLGKNRVAALTYQNNARLTHIGQVSGQNADVGFDGVRRIVNHRWETFTTSSPQALGAGTLVMGFEHQDGSGNTLYDRANNKRIEYKTHDPGDSEQYKYDSAYRLTSTGSGSQGANGRGFERGTFASSSRTSMSTIGFFQDWDLDALGNWTREDDNARIETRLHSDFNDINQRTVGGQNSAPTYDLNGNTTDTGYSSLGGQSFPGGGLRMVYDAFNRVQAVYQNSNTPGVTTDDVLVATYVYDCQNRRHRKVVTNSGSLNGTTDFYYDGWRVLEEHDGTDAITQQYAYGNYLDEVWTLDNRRGGGTIAFLNDNTGNYRHFYLSNTLYHVYGIMNEGGGANPPGVLQEAYQYDAYGKQTVITNSGGTVLFNNTDTRTVGGASTINGSPYMYTGQRFDPESGLLYFKNRVYSQDLGRFLSRDVPGNSPDYFYARSNPSNMQDPLGLSATSATSPSSSCQDPECGGPCSGLDNSGFLILGPCFLLKPGDVTKAAVAEATKLAVKSAKSDADNRCRFFGDDCLCEGGGIPLGYSTLIHFDKFNALFCEIKVWAYYVGTCKKQ